MKDLVLYFSLKYNGDFEKIYKAIKEKEPIDSHLKEKMFKQLNCNYITIFDKEYPNELKEINCPPFVLYYYGNLDLLNDKKVAVVGSSSFSTEGKQSTKNTVKDLIKEDFTIISGLSQGISQTVFEEAIKHSGHTIAVLDYGIERFDPNINEKIYEELRRAHLIISEYPFDLTADKKKIMSKNRLISGLCSQLIITECKTNSSVISTVFFALEQGKDVFCIPSSVSSLYQGTNELIKQGAMLFNNIKDLGISQ